MFRRKSLVFFINCEFAIATGLLIVLLLYAGTQLKKAFLLQERMLSALDAWNAQQILAVEQNEHGMHKEARTFHLLEQQIKLQGETNQLLRDLLAKKNNS